MAATVERLRFIFIFIFLAIFSLPSYVASEAEVASEESHAAATKSSSYLPHLREMDEKTKVMHFFVAGGQVAVEPGEHQDILELGIQILKKKKNFGYFRSFLEVARNGVRIDNPNITLLVVSDWDFPSLPPRAHALVYQILPRFYSPAALMALTPLSLIPTIDPNCSILVTTDPSQRQYVSFNRISLSVRPIYVGKIVVVYQSEAFLDPSLYLLRQYDQPLPPPSTFGMSVSNLILFTIVCLCVLVSWCVGCKSRYDTALDQEAERIRTAPWAHRWKKIN